jgi:hypothetical protein
MSPEILLTELLEKSIIGTEQAKKITDYEQLKPFSVHHELRAVLYIGIGLLSAGLGWLLYEHYNQIGPNTILTGLVLLCVSCFVFAGINRPPWSIREVESRSPLAAPALLLGCLLLLTVEGYVQYQYQLFGTRYRLAILLPALLFLVLAYRFDNRAVLGLGLTTLISWLGITVRPLEFYVKGNFVDAHVTASAIAASVGLLVLAQVLAVCRIKPHFTYTYFVFSGNLLFVSLLAALFNFSTWRIPVVLGLAVACFVADRYALHPDENTHRPDPANWLFLLMGVVYGFIGATFLFFNIVPGIDIISGSLYFIVTGLVLIRYLLRRVRTIRQPYHQS